MHALRSERIPPWGLFLIAACGAAAEPEPDPLRQGTPWFEELAAERGIEFVCASGHVDGRYLFPELMCSGAALFNMDTDGDLDAYLVQAGSVSTEAERGPNRLYANLGDGSFADRTAGSGADDRGYGMGVACGDVDGDGDPELYVNNWGANALLDNRGAGRFTDVTGERGGGDPSWSVSSAFFDPDRDGDLDLFVVNYVFWTPADEIHCSGMADEPDYCSPRAYDAPAPDTLYRNDGAGGLADASSAAGLRAVFGNGLGVLASDFDRDGWCDVFVANDGTPNQLWLNRTDGSFTDEALLFGCAVDDDGGAKAGMGVAGYDWDQDGDEDLLVVNMAKEADSFHENQGAYFVDRTASFGAGTLTRAFTRFGTGLLDFDNDGKVDLFQANGRVARTLGGGGGDPYAEENVLLRGEPGPRFSEVLPRGGVARALVATSRAAAFGDVDGDGGLDVLVSNRDAPAHLLFNVVPARGHWLRLVASEEGRDALGAELVVTVGDTERLYVVRSATSYASACDPGVHVGLGQAEKVTRVAVRWVDGTEELFGPFAVDRSVSLVRGAGRRP